MTVPVLAYMMCQATWYLVDLYFVADLGRVALAGVAMRRHRHVTLQLLWEEYAERYGAAAYRGSAFCDIYRRWEKRLKHSMRHQKGAGSNPPAPDQ
jgi:hypothetical protein